MCARLMLALPLAPAVVTDLDAQATWQPEAGVTTASHSDITGLVAAASTTSLRFDGSPLQRFMAAAFDGALHPGCSSVVANK